MSKFVGICKFRVSEQHKPAERTEFPKRVKQFLNVISMQTTVENVRFALEVLKPLSFLLRLTFESPAYNVRVG